MKRLAVVIFAGLVIAAFVVVVSLRSDRPLPQSLENWIGQQLQDVANSYLQPQLSFERLEYQYPGTVRLTGVRLSADDPHNAGKTVDILGAKSAELTLAEIPTIGAPLVIEKISLTQPFVQAVADAPGGKDFVGFSHLLRIAPATQPGQPSAARRVSDYFRMRLIELNDARIVYDPRIEGAAPMQLDHISTHLDIQHDDVGWYKVALKAKRDPLFAIDVAGRLSLDSFSAEQLSLTLRAKVDDQKDDYLPPQLQKLLKEHQIHGALEIKLAGAVPELDYQRASGLLDVTLSDGSIVIGDYRIPVQSLTLNAMLANQQLTIPSLMIRAPHGLVASTAVIKLNPMLDATAALTVHDLLIQDAYVDPNSTAKRMVGRLNGEAKLAAPLAAVFAHLAPSTRPTTDPSNLPANWGDGHLTLDQAQVVYILVLDKLVGAISEGMSLVRGRPSAANSPQDRVTATFQMTGDHVTISDFQYSGDVVTAGGDGTIGLNRSIEMLVRGGPIGLSGLTAKLAHYHITGTLDDPNVQFEFGAGPKAAASSSDNVIDSVGKGVDKVGELGSRLLHLGQDRGEQKKR